LILSLRETEAPRWNVDLIDWGVDDGREARINNLIIIYVAVSSRPLRIAADAGEPPPMMVTS
jgi:hypothetical protein